MSRLRATRFLLKILREKMQIPITGGVQQIEAMVADQAIASALSISICSPILYIEVLVFSRGKKPVEFVQNYNRADQVKFTLTLDLKGNKIPETKNKVHLARKA